MYPVSADDTCILSKTVDDLLLDVAPEQDAVKVSGGDTLSTTGTFMAPVVPDAKTISQDKIYMAFLSPVKGIFGQETLPNSVFRRTAGLSMPMVVRLR